MPEVNVGQVLLSVQNVSRSFGSQPVLDNVSVSVHEAERLGLVGRNGSGKSTLLRILMGLDTPDSGQVTRKQGLTVKLLTQTCALPKEQTVGAALWDANARWHDLAARHSQLGERLGDDLPAAEHARVQREFEEVDHLAQLHDVWQADARAARLASALRLPGEDAVLGKLSGGELRRVDIAVTLLTEPDVLLLDEPTNHIDAESAMWIEQYLSGYPGSCVLVTHDRYFLDKCVSRIVEMDRRRLYSFPGNYEQFLEYKAQILDVEARTESARQSEIRHELVWLRRGAKARRTKEQARVRRVEALIADQGPEVVIEPSFEIPLPQRLGDRVIDAEQIAYKIGGRTLFDKLTLIMQRGMRVGIAGPNGCGKTTLLRVLMGQEKPQVGTIKIGDSVQFLYIDQTHADIDLKQSVIEFVSGGAHYWDVGEKRVYVPGYLERLLFDMDSVRAPMRNLSGGERNRVVLAKKLLQGGNVLAFDEPTNDLDLATLRVLEEAILVFEGCALLVSHDRYFLNRVCTHMIVFEGDGKVYCSAGNYDDYLAYRERRDEAARDGVVAEKPLTILPGSSGAPKNGSTVKPLSYMEKKELAGIQKAIEAAEAEVAQLEAEVATPEFYTQPHDAVRAKLAVLDEAKAKAQTLYSRWEELEARANAK